MSNVYDIVLQFGKDLNTRAANKVKKTLKERAIPSFRKELDLMSSQSYKISEKRVGVLKRNILLSGRTIQETPTGIRITLALTPNAEEGGVEKWARKIDIGGRINSHPGGWMAIPFNKGPYTIVGYAKSAKGDPNIVHQFIQSNVATGDNGKLKLQYKEASGGKGLVMSGKLKGGKWEPIAYLTESFNTPATGWIRKFLNRVASGLDTNV